MTDNKKTKSEQDLSNSSATLQHEKASVERRGIAGQNLANYRWLL